MAHMHYRATHRRRARRHYTYTISLSRAYPSSERTPKSRASEELFMLITPHTYSSSTTRLRARPGGASDVRQTPYQAGLSLSHRLSPTTSLVLGVPRRELSTGEFFRGILRLHNGRAVGKRRPRMPRAPQCRTQQL